MVRCLRIQNYRDAITMLPHEAHHIQCFSCDDRNLYKHVGLELTIDKKGTYEFAYSRDKGKSFGRTMKNGTAYFGHGIGVLLMMPVLAFHSREFLTNHNCGEYRERFEKFAKQNTDVYLNDIYQKDVPDCDSEVGI